MHPSFDGATPLLQFSKILTNPLLYVINTVELLSDLAPVRFVTVVQIVERL